MKKKVAVLMGSYNGSLYIIDQLESIFSSKHVIDIYISDDASKDDTIIKINKYIKDKTDVKVLIFSGPQKGFSENFRSLIQRVSPNYEYYCFCDQDDIWYEDKISRSIKKIESSQLDIPILYGSRTLMIDSKGKRGGLSPAFERDPCFSNALIQSIAGGNTMMMNNAAMKILKIASKNHSFVSHDWFAYQIITGVGGKVIFDQTPSVYYRQHDYNVVGKNTGVYATIRRIKAALGGRFKQWNEVNLKFLNANLHLLTQDSIRTMKSFESARHGHLLQRFSALWLSGVKRQTIIGTIYIWIACFLKKL